MTKEATGTIMSKKKLLATNTTATSSSPPIKADGAVAKRVATTNQDTEPKKIIDHGDDKDDRPSYSLVNYEDDVEYYDDDEDDPKLLQEKYKAAGKTPPNTTAAAAAKKTNSKVDNVDNSDDHPTYSFVDYKDDVECYDDDEDDPKLLQEKYKAAGKTPPNTTAAAAAAAKKTNSKVDNVDNSDDCPSYSLVNYEDDVECYDDDENDQKLLQEKYNAAGKVPPKPQAAVATNNNNKFDYIDDDDGSEYCDDDSIDLQISNHIDTGAIATHDTSQYPGAVAVVGSNTNVANDMATSEDTISLNSSNDVCNRQHSYHDEENILVAAEVVPDDCAIISAEVVHSNLNLNEMEDRLRDLEIENQQLHQQQQRNDNDEVMQRKSKRYYVIGGFLLLFVIIVVAVVFAVLTINGSPSPSPTTEQQATLAPGTTNLTTEAPTTALTPGLSLYSKAEKFNSLLDQISSNELTKNSTSDILQNDLSFYDGKKYGDTLQVPQIRAVDWILNGDGNGLNEELAPSSLYLVQIYALATFYYETSGAFWFNNDNWLNYDKELMSSASVCTWYGISCDKRQSIVESIDLSSNNLRGTLLPDTNELSLIRNNYNNQTVQVLNFQNNYFLEGKFPEDALGALHNLVVIHFENNRLEGELPQDSFFESTNIEQLYLYGNLMEGQRVPYSMCQKYLNSTPPDAETLFTFIIDCVKFDSCTCCNSEVCAAPKETSKPTPSTTDNTKPGLRSILEDLITPATQTEIQAFEDAYKWITEEDELKLTEKSPNVEQRFILAYFYYHVTIEGQWASCDKPDERAGEDDTCNLRKFYRDEDDQVIETFESDNIRWLSKHSECDWAGIFCNENDDISAIDIFYQGFTGPLPAGLAAISTLSFFGLSFNDFTGTIPEAFAKLTGLINIELNGNLFEGPFPVAYYNAPTLQRINFGENSLVGPFNVANPDGTNAIDNLRDLKSFFIDLNVLTGGFPTNIGQLSSLRFARFSENDFSDSSIPTEFGKLKRLRELWIDNMNLLGTIPTELGMLTQMSDLRISNNFLEGPIPEEIYNIDSFYELDVSTNLLTGTISTRIGDLDDIQILRFGENLLNGTVPTEVGQLTDLLLFKVQKNDLTGSMPDSVCGLFEDPKSNPDGQLFILNADCLGDKPQIECICCTACCPEDDGDCYLQNN